jgi:hypothetical protein
MTENDSAGRLNDEILPWERQPGEIEGAYAAFSRTARNVEHLGSHRQFHDAKLTVDAFAKLVASGGDPTELLDLTGASRVVERDNGMTWADIQQLIEDSSGGQRVRN